MTKYNDKPILNISLYDENFNKLEYERCDIISQSNHNLKLQLKSICSKIFTDEELRTLHDVLHDAVRFADEVMVIRQYLQILDKIDKVLEKE